MHTKHSSEVSYSTNNKVTHMECSYAAVVHPLHMRQLTADRSPASATFIKAIKH